MQIDHLKEFKESNHGKAWAKASDSSWFHEGLKTALHIYQTPVCNSTDDAAANFHRIQGARAFANLLATMTDTTPEKQVLNRANLNHTV